MIKFQKESAGLSNPVRALYIRSRANCFLACLAKSLPTLSALATVFLNFKFNDKYLIQWYIKNCRARFR